MEHVLLSVHVLAAIVFVGGSAVAASLFPRYAPVAAGADSAGGQRNPAVAAALHRITGRYVAVALIVPVVGIALAALQGRLGEIWISTAMVLTLVAGGLIAVQIHPLQREALRDPDDGRRLRALGMYAGIYNTLWAIVVVLMIVRPGAS
ncbi:hypothetical protein [Nocardia farcinica]|uniref:hypothetical protein n=1 Tax=Nocardia farcinica TaxID=37329 RepID=UPI000E059FE5|nr:hypothetical protein [Nocardia farcinica]MBF6140412.1 hypothetical protein [Nocardia farcinica]MBF6295242.1 hypothetical protein [Nocardia farcinica]MBF6361684.1 hypothetical protein [Nocardia farcinica]MBF6381668.1 hypothetical protein [Nocardia farcinica]MBF6385793.1 hypothetical protein [Nocardia farcinica]